jgi:hypothetical protein
MSSQACAECGTDRAANPFAHHHHCSQHPRTIQQRRFALLQAAAATYSTGLHGTPAERVDVAEMLLAEIERREAQKAEAGQ